MKEDFYSIILIETRHQPLYIENFNPRVIITKRYLESSTTSNNF